MTDFRDDARSEYDLATVPPAEPFGDAKLQRILSAALAAWNRDKQQPFRPRFSNAGDPCVRALVLDERYGPRNMSEPRHMLAAAVGTAVGEVLEAGAHELGHDTQTPSLLPGDGVSVSGKLDVLLPDAVLDWKVVGEKSWHRLDRGAQEKHVLQVASYAVAQQRPGWVLAYLRGSSIFADELEWWIFRGAAELSYADRTLAVWSEVMGHVKAGTLPAIPRGFRSDRFPCGWCSHAQYCYEETKP